MGLFLPCWLFGLRHPSIGPYRLLGRARSWWENGGLQESSWQRLLSRTIATVPLSLPWATAAPCLYRRPSDTSRWVWSRLFMRSVLFPLGSSVYNVLWKFQEYNFYFLCNSCNQTPLVFKTMWSGSSSSYCQTLRLGSLTWGSERPLLWEKLSDIIIFTFVGHPSSGYGIWFYPSCTTPVFSWLLLWM